MKTLLPLTLSLILLSCEEPVPFCPEIVGDIKEYCEPAAELFLESQGGNGNVAIQIANNTETVMVGKFCKSSCVFIASRAEKRIACHNTWFGLHQATTDLGTKKTLDFFKEDERLDYTYFESVILNTPNSGMHSFPAHRALEVGLIDEIKWCD